MNENFNAVSEEIVSNTLFTEVIEWTSLLASSRGKAALFGMTQGLTATSLTVTISSINFRHSPTSTLRVWNLDSKFTLWPKINRYKLMSYYVIPYYYFLLYKERFGFVKIFDIRFLMKLNVLECPELDLTIFGKCLSACMCMRERENFCGLQN